jgi:hypothetical protein
VLDPISATASDASASQSNSYLTTCDLFYKNNKHQQQHKYSIYILLYCTFTPSPSKKSFRFGLCHPPSVYLPQKLFDLCVHQQEEVIRSRKLTHYQSRRQLHFTKAQQQCIFPYPTTTAISVEGDHRQLLNLSTKTSTTSAPCDRQLPKQKKQHNCCCIADNIVVVGRPNQATGKNGPIHGLLCGADGLLFERGGARTEAHQPGD